MSGLVVKGLVDGQQNFFFGCDSILVLSFCLIASAGEEISRVPEVSDQLAQRKATGGAGKTLGLLRPPAVMRSVVVSVYTGQVKSGGGEQTGPGFSGHLMRS